MKKYLVPAALFALTVLISGCVRTSTLEWIKPDQQIYSSSGKPVIWHLEARNCGLYLFNVFPIWSGKVDYPNRKDYELWQDMVNYWDMRRLLDRELKRLGADEVEDISMKSYSSGAWGLWIFWKKSMTASGVAVKNVPKTKKMSTK